MNAQPTPGQIRELLDKQEIAELSHKYMRALDRLDKELMLSVFHPDATTDYGFFQGSGPDFVDYAQNALKDHISNQHMIGQILIDVEGRPNAQSGVRRNGAGRGSTRRYG